MTDGDPRRDGAFRPFRDEAAVASVGALSLENRLDRVSLHGSLDIARDRAGLGAARELLALLTAVVAALEAEGARLPETAPPPMPDDEVPNPFR